MVLHDPTPESNNRSSHGEYAMQDGELHDDRPVFVLGGEEDRKLYHAEGTWWVFNVVGEPCGFIKSAADATSPELVTEWEVVVGGKFVPAPGLQCLLQEEHQRRLQTRLEEAQPADTVFLTGLSPGQMSSLGEYVRCEGEELSNRYVYERVGTDVQRKLYYAGGNWFVSEVTGEKSGFIQSEDTEALTPERVPAGKWQVVVKGMFVDAPCVSCSATPLVLAGVLDDGKFIDVAFPPNSLTSLGAPKDGDASWCTADCWMRAPELLCAQLSSAGAPTSADVQLFERIEPADIMQGQLGNCWLMGAPTALLLYCFTASLLSRADRY